MSPPILPPTGPHIVRLDGYISPPPSFSPDFLHKYTSHHNTPHNPKSIIERLSDADVVVTTRVPLNREVIEACKGKLRLIAVFAIGYDMVDVEACKKHGVQVRNVRGASVESVAEHALGFYFGLRRGLLGMQHALTQTNEWAEKGNCFTSFGPLPRTLARETIGIIGVGELGTTVAKHFTALGSTVLLAERPTSTSLRPGRTAFKETLQNSTVLIITTAATPETRNLISDAELALLPADALVINVARGEVYDEDALVRALQEKRIAGAATDVYIKEPASRESSVLVREAENLEGRLIVSPHVAWYAIASVEKLREVTARNIEEWSKGERGENFVC